MQLNIDSIQTEIKAANRVEAIRAAAAPLLERHWITEGYLRAVLEREKTFPTGLPAAVGVAIPHADPEGVLREAVSMITLERPVAFGAMGAPEETVMVSILFLLAIKDGNAQIDTLQAIVGVIQNEMVLQKITGAKKPEKVYNLFNEIDIE